jgi:hypothetical protein
MKCLCGARAAKALADLDFEGRPFYGIMAAYDQVHIYYRRRCFFPWEGHRRRFACSHP